MAAAAAGPAAVYDKTPDVPGFLRLREKIFTAHQIERKPLPTISLLLTMVMKAWGSIFRR